MKNATIYNEKFLIQENARLKAAVEELSILNDIAAAISSVLELNKIIELIIQRCIRHLNAEQGVVMLLTEENPDKPFHTIFRDQKSVNDFLPYRFDDQLTGWILKNRSPLLINNLSTDDRFDLGSKPDLPINSLLCVPLTLKSRMIGLIALFNKKSESGFSLDDQRLLSIIAAQSAQVIENARLVQKEQTLIRIEEEVRMAKEIQLNILPKKIPVIQDYDISAVNIPARDIGGDYYDFITLSEDTIAICLGDISGKGIPAALLMANLQATLRSQANTEDNVSVRIKKSNRLLFHSTNRHMFATLFYGELNLSTNKLVYCNAGHCPPFMISNNKVITLYNEGVILGCFERAEFRESWVIIRPSDLIVLYSDGITEARNEVGDQFGEDRLLDIIMATKHLSSREMLNNIVSNLNNYSSGTEQTDDITLMIIKRIQ